MQRTSWWFSLEQQILVSANYPDFSILVKEDGEGGQEGDALSRYHCRQQDPTLLLLRPWCLREGGSPEWKAFAKVFFQISQNVIMGQELRIYSG